MVLPLPFWSKLVKKPIRVIPAAFILCGVCSSSKSDKLEYIYRRNYFELVKEKVAHIAKTTL
jgi:hypothetical protein